MEGKITEKRELLKSFRKEHGSVKVGEINVGQVLGGMRGMLGMIY
jgi:citrate synthase